jgi:hypothetical protein
VELVTPERDEPVRPVLGLPAVSPVSAATRPTPLIQPATGPTVIDRDAFAAVLRAHRAETDATAATAGTPVVFPEEHAAALPVAPAADDDTATSTSARAGWWARVVAAVLRAVGVGDPPPDPVDDWGPVAPVRPEPSPTGPLGRLTGCRRSANSRP